MIVVPFYKEAVWSRMALEWNNASWHKRRLCVWGRGGTIDLKPQVIVLHQESVYGKTKIWFWQWTSLRWIKGNKKSTLHYETQNEVSAFLMPCSFNQTVTTLHACKDKLPFPAIDSANTPQFIKASCSFRYFPSDNEIMYYSCLTNKLFAEIRWNVSIGLLFVWV